MTNGSVGRAKPAGPDGSLIRMAPEPGTSLIVVNFARTCNDVLVVGGNSFTDGRAGLVGSIVTQALEIDEMLD